MANEFVDFFYPAALDARRNLLPSGVDEGLRRIYDMYYSQYRSAMVFYRDSNGVLVIAPVTVGAADSGGTGFRLLRIPNGN